MAKTILVCGYGPGISNAVAEKFGSNGFQVVLVARNAERLEAGVKALAAKGVRAAAFPADLADPKAAAAVVAHTRDAVGPVSVIHWNAYSGLAGDLLAADVHAIHGALDIATTSLLVAVQAALPDLRKAEDPAVLVTNGGFGKILPAMDGACVQYNAMGVGLANAAKDKLVGMLAKKLEADRIYVGQVTVLGTIKGTAWDDGNATMDASTVADRFWSMYRERKEVRVDQT